MPDGWNHEFDLNNVLDEVMRVIQNGIKIWDDAAKEYNEERIKNRQEESERLKTQYEELKGDVGNCVVPNPNYYKCGYCPCINGGDGGLIQSEYVRVENIQPEQWIKSREE